MSASSAPTDFLPRAFQALPESAAPRAEMQAGAGRVPAMTSRRRSETLQFYLILAATYPFFLVAALVRRSLPAQAAAPGSEPARRSVFGQAKEMASSAIPFVFMG